MSSTTYITTVYCLIDPDDRFQRSNEILAVNLIYGGSK